MAKKPRYAVITLDDKVDVGSFFNLLSSNGYSNVAFVTSLTECQEVRKAIKGNSASSSSALADLVAASPEVINVDSSPLKSTMPSTSVIVSKTTPLVFDDGGTPPYKANAEVINCKLCDNKIMCSRLSNLTNHVRRHSSVKQYSCVYCPYQHNEMSKVRTHMAGQHGDTLTAPNDNLTPELQKIWCAYMEKCFPGYLESLGKIKTQLQTGKNAVEVFGGRTLARMEGGGGVSAAGMPICINLDEEVVPLTDKLHTCLECGDAVPCEDSSTEPLIDHIQQKHADSCAPFKCGECGYLNAHEYEVSAHVSAEHAMIASVVTVTEEPLSADYHMFIPKFFPSVEGGIDDSPEVFIDTSQLSAEDLLKGEEEESPATIAQALNAEALLGALSEESVSSPDENHHFPCTVCGCNFNTDDVDGMMYHAKEHYCIKQFGCPHCAFGSNELYEARNHLSEEHAGDGRIIDHNSELMQQAWMQTMKECFPTAASHILKKTSKSDSSAPSRKRLRV